MDLVEKATKNNYAENFWKAAWTKIKDYQVHHSLPQKYVKMFEEIGVNIHENKYLRGIKKTLHTDITNAWNSFDPKWTINRSIDEIKSFAAKIDIDYRDKFIFTK